MLIRTYHQMLISTYHQMLISTYHQSILIEDIRNDEQFKRSYVPAGFLEYEDVNLDDINTVFDDPELLVDRMRSYGPYITLHLRYEEDMLAFSGCTNDLSPGEADELRIIIENTAYWKVKDIDSTEQRAKGYCLLTLKEVRMFLTALGFPSNTPIYIVAGEIYGGDTRMADLQSRYPILMNKEDCFYDLPYNTGYQISVLRLRKTMDEIMKCTLSLYVDIYFD